MDKFVLGKRRVNCEIIEADREGNPPDEDDFKQNSQSLLDIIASKRNKVIMSYCACGHSVDILSSPIPLRS